MFKEFRDFAIKGNAIDLAIGVIIGAAFGAIVSSIVDDLFMPIIGLILNGVDFSNMFIVLNNPNNVPVPSLAAARLAGVATLNVGLFINAVVKFVIIAFVLFLVVKGINSLKREEKKDEAAAPPAPTKEEILLTEIRDAIKDQGTPRTAALAAPRPATTASAPAKAPAPKAAAKPAPVKAPAAAKKPAAKKPADKPAK